jgi:hypothetical protein
MLAEELTGASPTALGKIVSLVDDSAECYLEARIAKFQDLQTTRDPLNYQAIVEMTYWRRQLPPQWDPDLSIFRANICSEPWYETFVVDDASVDSAEDGVIYLITAFAADTQIPGEAKEFGVFSTITKRAEDVEPSIVFEKHYAKPAIL